MKRTLLTTLTAAFLLAAAARSASATEVGYSRKLGLGVMLGDPTGLSGKYWIGGTNAIDFGLGFANYGPAFYCNNNTTNDPNCFGAYNTNVSSDYLWQSKLVRSTAQLDWYVGVGGRAFLWGNNNAYHGFDLAARAPIGLALMFNNPSFLEIFFELVPELRFFPVRFDPVGALGVRFFF
jgi:hypothetical protein